jgi:hypothetical protein
VQTMVAGTGPFAAVQGTRLALVDGISSFAFAGFAFAALSERRNPHLHGGWLLATAIMLVMPVVTRLLPWSEMERLRPELTGIERFTVAFDISSAVALGIALTLAWMHPKGRRPFLAVALVTLVQWVGFHLTDHVPAWRAFTAVIAGAPALMLPLMGVVLGAAAVWLGWQAGTPARRKAAAR